MEKRRKSAALLPVGVFLVFYLGLGILLVAMLLLILIYIASEAMCYVLWGYFLVDYA